MKPSRFFPAALVAGALALGTLRVSAGHDEEEGDPRFRAMDADGDSRVSTAEHAAAASSGFARMDTDQDGYVTAAEMEAQEAHQKDAALRLRVATPAEATDLGLGSGAARADGSVSSHEVANARGAAPAEPSAAENIRLSDRDGDGRLTASEYAAAAGALFSSLDADGDGYLSRIEFERGSTLPAARH